MKSTVSHRGVGFCVEVEGSDDGELAGAFVVRATRGVDGHPHEVAQSAVLALEGRGQLLGQGELEGEVVGAWVQQAFVVNLLLA